MNTEQLLIDAKAKFNHNLAKITLQEKYKNRLVVAKYGGLWQITPELISFLKLYPKDTVVLVDTYNNPVLVECQPLADMFISIYENTMTEWYEEWKKLEQKR